MAEPFYVSRSEITQPGTLHRRAKLAVGPTVDFGVHGPVVDLFKLAPERPLPLPVDYIVAATGG